jgi:hypothetical protein
VLAFEFWGEEFLGEFAGELEIALMPHSARVLRLRPRPGHPAILGDNRHILMGPGTLEDETWDASTRTLRVRVHTTRDFEHRLAVWMPPGAVPRAAALAGHSAPALERLGETVLRARFIGADTGWHDFSLSFE